GIAFKEDERIFFFFLRPFIKDLDSLNPAWDLINWKDYRYFDIPKSRLGAVSTSRGCSHKCTFCSQQKFWHQSWRARRPEAVVKEIEHLNKQYGVNVFLFTDEYPTQDRQRWERLLDLLIERDLGIYILMETRAEDIIRDRDILHKYRRAGIVHIYIGVESTEQETLDLIKKDIKVETGMEALRLIHEHGMISETSFILGFPDETRESIKKTLRLSKLYNPDFAHYLALAPWPYADMYEELKPHIKVQDYSKYNLIDPVIKPRSMSLKEVDRAIIECYQSFYMGKLTQLIKIKDEFKRRYILSSMKLIMNSSFIVDKLGSLGKIPAQVEQLIRKIEHTPVEKTPVSDPEVVTLASRTVSINAPFNDVFAFVSSSENWHRFINGLKEIRPIKRQG
ncbi:MAG: radical SAM protein, partial [Nitrospirae bacterium]